MALELTPFTRFTAQDIQPGDIVRMEFQFEQDDSMWEYVKVDEILPCCSPRENPTLVFTGATLAGTRVGWTWELNFKIQVVYRIFKEV